MQDYHFQVDTIEYGHRKQFGGEYFHYRVVNLSELDWDPVVVRKFCTEFLFPAAAAEDRQEAINDGNTAAMFWPYWIEFTNVGERQYEYKAFRPATRGEIK